ncbi:MAG: ATP-binding protein [Hahellaceae bacterium]|nr:ATP-binding protein [Hahellaceae bacterium]
MDNINWHFSRHTLATHFLDAFASGITGALTLFAPRRMGKTEFILLDLAPAAEQRGYFVIYCSFWHLQSHPAKALRYALEEALQHRDWKARMAHFIAGNSSVELSGSSLGTKVALKATGKDSRAEQDDLLAIMAAFRTLAQQKKPVLLLLDEVQHLGTHPAYEPLVAMLRTEFELYRKSFFVVFTGSSRDGLMRMFRDRKAPMFHASQQIDLPDLGAEFIAHMLMAFEQATQHKVARAPAVRAFAKLQYVPALFHQLLRFMLINGIWDISRAMNDFHPQASLERDYTQLWEALKSIDKGVLLLLNTPSVEGLYSDVARQWLGDYLGVDSVSVSTIQNAIDRLRKEHLIYSGGVGQWRFEDVRFAEWLGKFSNTPNETAQIS